MTVTLPTPTFAARALAVLHGTHVALGHVTNAHTVALAPHLVGHVDPATDTLH